MTAVQATLIAEELARSAAQDSILKRIAFNEAFATLLRGIHDKRALEHQTLADDLRGMEERQQELWMSAATNEGGAVRKEDSELSVTNEKGATSEQAEPYFTEFDESQSFVHEVLKTVEPPLRRTMALQALTVVLRGRQARHETTTVAEKEGGAL